MLVEEMFLEAFDNPALEILHDGATFEAGSSRLAVSTDSFVVRPLFFPGATSARSPCTGPSTTSPCAGRSRW